MYSYSNCQDDVIKMAVNFAVLAGVSPSLSSREVASPVDHPQQVVFEGLPSILGEVLQMCEDKTI